MKMKNLKWIALSLGVVLLAGCGSARQKGKIENLPGGDRDSHGCIPSAGYTWSEVRKDCIRLFEVGIPMVAVGDVQKNAYLVFSPDSLQVELFFSDGAAPKVLGRQTLPGGGYAWNVEDDDTMNVSEVNGAWTISQRGKILYTQRVK